MAATAEERLGTDRRWSMHYTPVPGSARLVRRHVRRALTSWGYPTHSLTDPLIVVGELASNAIRHGRVPGQLFEVSVGAREGFCLIEVSDPHPGRPIVRQPTDEDAHGRGLLLVSGLSERWGIREQRHGTGKTLYARVPLR